MIYELSERIEVHSLEILLATSLSDSLSIRNARRATPSFPTESIFFHFGVLHTTFLPLTSWQTRQLPSRSWRKQIQNSNEE